MTDSVAIARAVTSSQIMTVTKAQAQRLVALYLILNVISDQLRRVDFGDVARYD
jgi:hypothetical protein